MAELFINLTADLFKMEDNDFFRSIKCPISKAFRDQTGIDDIWVSVFTVKKIGTNETLYDILPIYEFKDFKNDKESAKRNNFLKTVIIRKIHLMNKS